MFRERYSLGAVAHRLHRKTLALQHKSEISHHPTVHPRPVQQQHGLFGRTAHGKVIATAVTARAPFVGGSLRTALELVAKSHRVFTGVGPHETMIGGFSGGVAAWLAFRSVAP